MWTKISLSSHENCFIFNFQFPTKKILKCFTHMFFTRTKFPARQKLSRRRKKQPKAKKVNSNQLENSVQTNQTVQLFMQSAQK